LGWVTAVIAAAIRIAAIAPIASPGTTTVASVGTTAVASPGTTVSIIRIAVTVAAAVTTTTSSATGVEVHIAEHVSKRVTHTAPITRAAPKGVGGLHG
jgi:hypothetical protein